MTTLTPDIKADLIRYAEDQSIFPRDMKRETLEFLIAQDDMDMYIKLQSGYELTIRDHGMQILSIFPTEDDEDQTYFGYTIGCDRLGVPEFLTFYPSAPTQHWVFNKMYKLMLDMKLELPTDPAVPVMVSNILDGDLQVALVLLTEAQRKDAYDKYTCQVESADTPVIQVVMPLPDGRWISDFIPPGFLPPSVDGRSLFN